MLVITGTGRAGASVIAEVFNKMNMLPYEGKWVQQFNSGLEPPDVSRVNSAIWLGNDMEMQSIPAQEAAIRGFDYSIIKDNKFFYGNVLNTWLSVRKDLKFLVCVRKFSQVQKSRIDARQLNMVRTPQELEGDLGRFVSQLIFNEIPFEFVYFPRFIEQKDDVREKILRLEPSMKLNKLAFNNAWKKTADINKARF
jgi:hypothetical protein